MTVTFLDKTYECSTAIKGSDYVHLLDGAGLMIVSFECVKNFSLFKLSGGYWTEITNYDDCPIAVIAPDGTIKKGSRKCSEVGELSTTKPWILTSEQYGDTLPDTATPGRLFFLKMQ